MLLMSVQTAVKPSSYSALLMKQPFIEFTSVVNLDNR